MSHSFFTLTGSSFTNIAEHTLHELLTQYRIVDIARIVKTHNGRTVVLYDSVIQPDVPMTILENRLHLTYMDLLVLTTMNIRTAAAAEYVCGTHIPAGPCSLERSTGAESNRDEVVAAGPCSLDRSTGADLSGLGIVSAGPCVTPTNSDPSAGPHDGYSG